MKNLKLAVLLFVALAFSCKTDKKKEVDYSKKGGDAETAGIQISKAEIERGSEIYFDK